MKLVGFEHLHRHCEFSLLDGYARVEEYARRSTWTNQHYLCITDHGMMGAVPRQIRCCEEVTDGRFEYDGKKYAAHRLKPIFGIELYLQDQHVPEAERKILSPDELREQRKSYHLLAIAKNLAGYRNIVQLSSWGHLKGFYYKPRVTYEQLMKHREGVIFTSCCYLSEIGQAFDRNLGPDGNDFTSAGLAAEEKLKQYIEMFGENFYLEVMLLDFRKQKPYDEWAVKMHDKYHLPIVCTQDAHFAEPEDSKYQRYQLMVKRKTTIADVERESQGEDAQENFVNQDPNLWMKSEEELNDKWLNDPATDDAKSYREIIPLEVFELAKANTVKICEMAQGVVIDRESKLPQIPDEKEVFLDLLVRGMKWRGIWKMPEYRKRMMEEYELIVRKGFASYFIIQKMFCDEARRVCPQFLGWGLGHEALGPGRGSGVASLCNYVLGITDVDPVKHGLLFSRFLSEARGGKSVKTRLTGPPIPLME